MKLTREDIESDIIRRLILESDIESGVLSDAELAASLRWTLAEVPSGTDVWLFGYGSLLWNPAIHFVESRAGRIFGYHRRFCLWTLLGRGTRARPGLTLGLERGGSCSGVAYRIAAPAIQRELSIVWRREMVTGAYIPRWVSVRTPRGPVRAVTFAINQEHVRYAGMLPEDEVAVAIASARGELGPCADYLFNTVAHLEEIGIRDRPLAQLAAQVAALRALGADRD